MRNKKILVALALFLPGLISANVVQGDAHTEATFDIFKVFLSCPIIYVLLILMSISALAVWIYSMLTLRQTQMMPKEFIEHVRALFIEQKYDYALEVCKKDRNFTAAIIAAGLSAKKHGAQVMMESMQSEGRRSGNTLWQRIALLNEIAVVAPMLGLLGTVVGLFFAFYESGRSSDSIASIFDGLGIAVGTTVVGLIVSILAMILYTTLKFKVVNLLNTIENESLALVSLVEMDHSRSSNHKKYE